MTLHIGQQFIPASPNQPFTLDLIPEDAIPNQGLVHLLHHWRDSFTGCWVVGWIREEGF